MSSIEIRTSLLAATACLLLATTACAPSGTAGETEPATDTSASPSPDASESADANATATVGGAFEFADGTTVGTLAEPWRVAGEVAGQLVHQVPGAAGANFDDAIWADLIVYVP